MADSTDSQIIEQLVIAGADGDRQAQQELLERFWPLIQHVVRGRRNRLGRELRLREDTQDLQQDVAIELLESLPKQRWKGRAAFVAWVRKLADCQVIDAQRYHRRQKRDRRAETSADKMDAGRRLQRTPESAIDDRRRLAGLLESITELKAEYGAALILQYQGYTHAQIGETLGCTAEAARKLVSRARAKLTGSKRR